MAKVIAICGKICSGKTYYANQIKEKEKAVILSCDELTKILFNNNLGDKHDEMSKKIWEYLLKKSVDLIQTGTNVILDWGFWSKNDRKYVSNYYNSQKVECEWHFIDIDDLSWQKNIEERNKNILDGNRGIDYYLDDGLMIKLLSKWETPTKKEINVWLKIKRYDI